MIASVSLKHTKMSTFLHPIIRQFSSVSRHCRQLEVCIWENSRNLRSFSSSSWSNKVTEFHSQSQYRHSYLSCGPFHIFHNPLPLVGKTVGRFQSRFKDASSCPGGERQRGFHTSGRVMAPIFSKKDEAVNYIDDLIKSNKGLIFSKTYCSYCEKAKSIFRGLNEIFTAIEVDTMDSGDMELIQGILKERTRLATFPNVFINGEHIGGSAEVVKLHENHKLGPMLQKQTENHSHGNISAATDKDSYDFDLIVIGGGSGGLAASKEAARLGAKVALLDFVKPSPQGSKWGLGGTCVNVGCIPKKFMHLASMVGETIVDAPFYGWNVAKPSSGHDWNQLVQNIQDRIKASNWGYRVALQEANVKYLNEYGEFVDNHTLKTVDKKGKTQTRTAKNIIIAVGGRPNYPDVKGAKEYAITSDDIFSLGHHPGKTLVVGASYIALETAGFLGGFGIDTTVMVRSILLRGFDQQVAELIGSYMEESSNVKFQRGLVPTSIRKVGDGKHRQLVVKSKNVKDGTEREEKFNTIIFAIGRYPVTDGLGLKQIGVQTDERTGKVIANESDETSVPNIFALGDCVLNRPELTPAAIQAGLLLSKRLYGGGSTLTDYKNCPTTIFTPLEYGCIGMAEEDAISKYGESDIEVFHTYFQSFESGLPNKDLNKCYAKLVCVKSLNEKVVGLHYLGPNAGEVTQGFALGIKFGATKSDFNSIIGIHPTSAENFTATLDITKSSGKDPFKKGCCG